MTAFAGIRPEQVAFFLERVELGPGSRSNKARSNRGGNMSGEVVRALARWRRLEREGWDVTALVDVKATHMIGLGCYYAEEPLKRAASQ